MVQLRELADTWSVDGLLALLATASPPYQALIDTGALVTGYSNLEVAAALLDGCLSFDPARRPSLDTILSSRWLAEHCGGPASCVGPCVGPGVALAEAAEPEALRQGA